MPGSKRRIGKAGKKRSLPKEEQNYSQANKPEGAPDKQAMDDSGAINTCGSYCSVAQGRRPFLLPRCNQCLTSQKNTHTQNRSTRPEIVKVEEGGNAGRPSWPY